jgi:DNA (cytosine-5)-methyltransferase 1
MIKYGSVCSGVEAATVAWHSLGWQPQWFSEIEAFPSAVLAHHYPNVPNHGDMTKFKEWNDAPIDLLVGGTPCQSFSVAGLRKGLDDPRGNLMLTYLAIAARYSPKWLVWENVPGVLSSNGGRDFGTFLGALGQLGYGFAYRVLDAQYFGVAQRRRRVFVVGYLGNWRRAAAVLFERQSLSGHSAPSREAREEIAQCLTRGVGQRYDPETETLPIAFGAQNSATHGASISEHVAPTLDKSKTPAVAFQSSQSGVRLSDTHATLDANNGPRRHNGAVDGLAVRRLTPRECERLQGFPDDYTLIPYRNKLAADGPRYKAMGNSMAVPVMRWIGERIEMVEDMR